MSTPPKSKPAIPVTLTGPQVDQMLNVSPPTRKGLVRSGALPAYRVGPRSVRFLLTDVEKLLVPVQVELLTARVPGDTGTDAVGA